MAIYFHGLQNLTMQGQYKICLHGHFHGNLFSQISLSQENCVLYSFIHVKRNITKVLFFFTDKPYS